MKCRTKILSLLLITIFLITTFSCQNKSNTSEQADFTESTDSLKCDTISKLPFMEIFVPGEKYDRSDTPLFGQSKYRFTFEQPTQVYSAPGSSSVMQILPPFTSITIEREGIEPQSKEKWYYISFRNANSDIFGYIKDQNIDIGNTGNNFILGTTTYSDKNSSFFKIVYTPRQYSWDVMNINDTLSLKINLYKIEYYNAFFLEYSNVSFQGNPAIVRLYWHHGESCPESEGNVFVVKNKENKLVELPQSVGSGEYGYYTYRKIYLPVKFGNGKTLLVENGDDKNMYNQWDQTTNTISYPTDCNIPLNELIVEIEATEEAKTNKNHEIIEDQNGSPIMEKTHHIVRYYRWTGLAAKLEKTIVYKDSENR